MEYFLGFAIASVVALTANTLGLDKDRAFYPTVMAVVASYYGLFAAMAGSALVILEEAAVMLVFLLAAVLGFKRNLWVVVAALVGHGILDCFHGHFISNPGIPVWWPMFCLTYDLVAGLLLAWLLCHDRISAIPPPRNHNSTLF